MSFDGHNKPVPRWFPYFFAGAAVAGVVAYLVFT
jgi:hypothetical protein